MQHTRLHFSYHKCLTVYSGRVLKSLDAPFSFPGRRSASANDGSSYVHLKSFADQLPEAVTTHSFVSLNNQFVDIGAYPEATVSRFIRDPRDLIVSGYWYHKRGAEIWTRDSDPTAETFAVVNGALPAAMPPGVSFAEYLSGLSEEDGMLAELEFRRPHFESMRLWDLSNPRVLLLRYDEIVGNEREAWGRVLDHHRVRGVARLKADRAVRAYSLGSPKVRPGHVRNPTSGQWHSALPKRVVDRVSELYGDVLEMYQFDV